MEPIHRQEAMHQTVEMQLLSIRELRFVVRGRGIVVGVTVCDEATTDLGTLHGVLVQECLFQLKDFTGTPLMMMLLLMLMGVVDLRGDGATTGVHPTRSCSKRCAGAAGRHLCARRRQRGTAVLLLLFVCCEGRSRFIGCGRWWCASSLLPNPNRCPANPSDLRLLLLLLCCICGRVRFRRGHKYLGLLSVRKGS